MLTLLEAVYGKVRAAWPVNRVVTLLTPLVFAPAAGYVATWVPQHVPGIAFQPSRAQLVGLFALGATRALVIAYKWLDGWQYHENRLALPKPTVEPPAPGPVVTIHNTPATVPEGSAVPPVQIVGAPSTAPIPGVPVGGGVAPQTSAQVPGAPAAPPATSVA